MNKIIFFIIGLLLMANAVNATWEKVDPGLSLTGYVASIKVSGSYAMALTDNNTMLYYDGSSWSEISGPPATYSSFGGWDKASDGNFYFYFMGGNPYEIWKFTPSSGSWSLAESGNVNYSTSAGIACVEYGAGYTGGSNDAECYIKQYPGWFNPGMWLFAVLDAQPFSSVCYYGSSFPRFWDMAGGSHIYFQRGDGGTPEYFWYLDQITGVNETTGQMCFAEVASLTGFNEHGHSLTAGLRGLADVSDSLRTISTSSDAARGNKVWDWNVDQFIAIIDDAGYVPDINPETSNAYLITPGGGNWIYKRDLNSVAAPVYDAYTAVGGDNDEIMAIDFSETGEGWAGGAGVSYHPPPLYPPGRYFDSIVFYHYTGSDTYDAQCTSDVDCGLCKKCVYYVDKAVCENQANTEDNKGECSVAYHGCDNKYTIRGDNGLCNGLGSCSFNDSLFNVSVGNVCIRGNDSDPTVAVHCDIWNDCVTGQCILNRYWVGYAGDGTNTCVENDWQYANRSFYVSANSIIAADSHSQACSIDFSANCSGWTGGTWTCNGCGSYDVSQCYNSCYQESATVPNQSLLWPSDPHLPDGSCALYNGSYTDEGTWSYPAAGAYDGYWYGVAWASFNRASVFVNYSIPDYADNLMSRWIVKERTGGIHYESLIIPSQCWNAIPGILSFKMTSARGVGSICGIYAQEFYCWDGNDWQIVACDGDPATDYWSYLWEDAMRWSVFGTPGQFCQAANCGNNIVEIGELCDGTALSGASCIDLGYDGGTLYCNNDCLSYDTSSCTMVQPGNISGGGSNGFLDSQSPLPSEGPPVLSIVPGPETALLNFKGFFAQWGLVFEKLFKTPLEAIILIGAATNTYWLETLLLLVGLVVVIYFARQNIVKKPKGRRK